MRLDCGKIQSSMPENTLYYGDNLDVLRRYVKDECALDITFRTLCTALC